MFKSSWFIAVISILIVSVNAWSATDEGDVEAVFQSYWTSTKQGDYDKAAEFVYPPDVAALHAGLLPVLIGASKSPNPELRQLVDFLCDNLPPERRGELTAPKLVSRITALGMMSDPDFLEMAKRSTVKPQKTKVSKGKEAKMTYLIVIDGKSIDDSAEFSKHEGRWYLRLDEPPADTVKKFKEVLGQK